MPRRRAIFSRPCGTVIGAISRMPPEPGEFRSGRRSGMASQVPESEFHSLCVLVCRYNAIQVDLSARNPPDDPSGHPDPRNARTGLQTPLAGILAACGKTLIHAGFGKGTTSVVPL